MSTKPKEFYVYAHKTKTTGVVFYIGKGSGTRAWSKSKRGVQWQRIAKKYGCEVQILEKGLQEWAAFEMEKDLIALYGRRDLGLGTLVNMTDGGEGGPIKLFTEEEKQKLSQIMKESYKRPDVIKRHLFAINTPEYKARHLKAVREAIKKPEYIEKMKSVTRKPDHIDRQRNLSLKIWADLEYRKKRTEALKTKEAKQVRSKVSKTLWQKPEYRNKMVQLLRNRSNHLKKPVICVEINTRFDCYLDAVNWLKQNGQKKAAKVAIRNACSGKAKTAYGYSWLYATNGT